MAAMMRARQTGHPCRIHGSWCEVSARRAPRNRSLENRAWRKEVDRG